MISPGLRLPARLRWLLVVAIAAAAGACTATEGRDQAQTSGGDAVATSTSRPLAGGADATAAPDEAAESKPERGWEQTPAPGEDLVLPDLEVMPVRELFIEGSGDERVLRFSTTVFNGGEGPLELVGIDEPPAGFVAVQHVLRDDGSYVQDDAGRFVYHDGHSHWHFDSFTLTEVVRVDEDGRLGEVVASTGKATFCPVDEVPERDDAPPPQYVTCDRDVQGISAGWSDTYQALLPGQELDIGALPDGRYALRATVDPDDKLREADDANNTRVELIEIEGMTVQVVDEE